MKGFDISFRVVLPIILSVMLLFAQDLPAKEHPARTSMQGSIDGFKSSKLKKRKILLAKEIKVLMLNNGKAEIQDYEIISFTFAIAPKKHGKHMKEPSAFIEMASGPKMASIATPERAGSWPSTRHRRACRWRDPVDFQRKG